MNNPVSNPNDHKVVSFHNSTDFGFTPDMGCMYDGRPINGAKGSPGIDAGETVILPYHIGHQLATNLAKVVMVRGVNNTTPQLDANGQLIIKAIWDTVKLEQTKMSFLKDMFVEQKPVAMSETDKLMAKVEEYKAMVDKLLPKNEEVTTVPSPQTEPSTTTNEVVPTTGGNAPTVYQDKQDVIKELERRQIKHDKRKSKDELEKLLQPVA